MNTGLETTDGLSNDPREYSLPKSVAVEIPDDLPSDVDTDSLPDEEVLVDYRDRDADELPTTDTNFTGSEHADTLLAVFVAHSERGMHPNELMGRSGLSPEKIPEAIPILREQDYIRLSRVVDGIPHYQLNQLSETARNAESEFSF